MCCTALAGQGLSLKVIGPESGQVYRGEGGITWCWARARLMLADNIALTLEKHCLSPLALAVARPTRLRLCA